MYVLSFTSVIFHVGYCADMNWKDIHYMFLTSIQTFYTCSQSLPQEYRFPVIILQNMLITSFTAILHEHKNTDR